MQPAKRDSTHQTRAGGGADPLPLWRCGTKIFSPFFHTCFGCIKWRAHPIGCVRTVRVLCCARAVLRGAQLPFASRRRAPQNHQVPHEHSHQLPCLPGWLAGELLGQLECICAVVNGMQQSSHRASALRRRVAGGAKLGQQVGLQCVGHPLFVQWSRTGARQLSRGVCECI